MDKKQSFQREKAVVKVKAKKNIFERDHKKSLEDTNKDNYLGRNRLSNIILKLSLVQVGAPPCHHNGGNWRNFNIPAV